MQTLRRFPEEFGVYRASVSLSDYMSRTTPTKDPSAISLPTTTPAASLALFCTPHPIPIRHRSQQHNSIHSPAQLTSVFGPSPASERKEWRVTAGGVFGGIDIFFSAYVAETGRQEVFEWKRSQGTEVRSLG